MGGQPSDNKKTCRSGQALAPQDGNGLERVVEVADVEFPPAGLQFIRGEHAVRGDLTQTA